ncbi:hypothetical protein ACFWAT_06415 [Streptomyces syringium]
MSTNENSEQQNDLRIEDEQGFDFEVDIVRVDNEAVLLQMKAY